MPDNIKKILDKVLDWWKKFNNKQRALLISIVAVVIVALIILAVVISKPKMVELVACEDAKTASEVKDVLDGENISYEVENNLVFYVNSSDEVNAVMALGAQNIPAASYDIDNVTDGGFSTTEADKQKKYQVYLESKFEEHLKQLDYVKSASVDITLPINDGTILASEDEGTAAVTLDTRSDISEDQAYAIARFVATELGNDSTKGITIINTQAEILYSGSDSETATGMSTTQLSYKQKLENQVKKQVKDTLGDNLFSNVQIGLNLDVNFDKTETTSKAYKHPEGSDDSYLDSLHTYDSSATNGTAATPGTDSNDDDTTYTTQDGTPSESSISERDYDYKDDETVTSTTSNGGTINYDTSSITVVATRYIVHREEDFEDSDESADQTWEQYKAANADPVKVDNVDADFIDSVSKSTGIATNNISFLVYEQAEFVDKDTSGRSLSDILQIVLAVIIFALLGFVVYRSTRLNKEVDLEEELSVQSLLDSTAETVEPLEDIGYNEKSETRIAIEKFVEENPEAVAVLLRNWLNEDWE